MKQQVTYNAPATGTRTQTIDTVRCRGAIVFVDFNDDNAASHVVLDGSLSGLVFTLVIHKPTTTAARAVTLELTGGGSFISVDGTLAATTTLIDASVSEQYGSFVVRGFDDGVQKFVVLTPTATRLAPQIDYAAPTTGTRTQTIDAVRCRGATVVVHFNADDYASSLILDGSVVGLKFVLIVHKPATTGARAVTLTITGGAAVFPVSGTLATSYVLVGASVALRYASFLVTGFDDGTLKFVTVTPAGTAAD
jgi:hypothetical protein